MTLMLNLSSKHMKRPLDLEYLKFKQLHRTEELKSQLKTQVYLLNLQAILLDLWVKIILNKRTKTPRLNFNLLGVQCLCQTVAKISWTGTTSLDMKMLKETSRILYYWH
jgi:hypothetical protein